MNRVIRKREGCASVWTVWTSTCVPRAGDFEAGIEMPGDGTVTVYANDFSQTFDISWSDKLNYFKAGVYVQDGPAKEFLVDYKKLLYVLDSGQNYL